VLLFAAVFFGLGFFSAATFSRTVLVAAAAPCTSPDLVISSFLSKTTSAAVLLAKALFVAVAAAAASATSRANALTSSAAFFCRTDNHFLRTGYVGLSCLSHPGNLVQDCTSHRPSSRFRRSAGRNSNVSDLASKRFGFRSRNFPRGYDNFSSTRHDVLTHHFISASSLSWMPSKTLTLVKSVYGFGTDCCANAGANVTAATPSAPIASNVRRSMVGFGIFGLPNKKIQYK